MTTKSPSNRRPYIEPFTGLDPDAAPDPVEQLPDAMYQEPMLNESIIVVRSYFNRQAVAMVSGDTPVYYRDETGQQRLVMPDLYVALGVQAASVRRRNGYFIELVGKPPDFVLEIASESTYPNDLGAKRDLYARLGVGEYWRFDGTGGQYYGEPLAGERLADGEYRRLEIHRGPRELAWGHSPTLGLDLCWFPERLRFYDPIERAYLLNLDESEAENRRLRVELHRLRGE